MTTDELSASDISVIIPTVGRPSLTRAVQSVLAQTRPVREIIVVNDGPEEIDLPAHPRLRVLRVGPGAGGNAARAKGVDRSTGAVVALLDDDDEWHEEKVALQLAALATAGVPDGRWLLSSRLVAQFDTGRRDCWPATLKSAGESLPEYLFHKRRLRGGVGFVQASTLMFPRALAEAVPFDPRLRFHQDISWLVDVARTFPGLSLVQAPEALVTYHVGGSTVSKKIEPDQSVRWARGRLSDNRRIFGDFLLTHSLICARNHGDLSAMVRVVTLALRDGRPGLPAVTYACVQLGILSAQLCRSVARRAAFRATRARAT